MINHPAMDLQKLFIVGKGSRALKKAWLEAYSMCGMWREACRQVGISHGAPNWWFQSDQKFVAAFERVKEIQATVLKDEIWERAVNGIDEPLTYQGKITGYFKRKSDDLLKFEARARMAEYREGGTTINVSPRSVSITLASDQAASQGALVDLDAPQLVDFHSPDKKSDPK